MRKLIISVVSVCVVLLAAFAIFALPVYNINDQTLVDRLDEKIEYIKEHDDPIAKVDQIFTKEIFGGISTNVSTSISNISQKFS